jgi:predicted ArsR family transcriptional regulator
MRQDRSSDRSSRKVVGSVKPETQSVTSDEAFRKCSGESSADVAAVASLDEPTRRRIYDHVCARALPLSRDEVTEALDIPRRTAAFHLDRLAEMGLLSVSFARRSGRSGPGAGRTAKLYQRSDGEVSVSLPPRHYDLAGHLLAGAVTQAQQSGDPPGQVLDQRAREFGRAIAREKSGWRGRPGQPEQSGPPEVGALMSLLEVHGFEPHLTGSDIVLNNCPFHALAEEHPGLVCGMNLHLIEGVLEGLRHTGVRALLDPGPSRCCVRMESCDHQ